jgi:hypothetical protein
LGRLGVRDSGGRERVSPRLNSLESLFDKEGLREFGARGLKRVLRQPPRIVPRGDYWHEWWSGGEKGILMHLSCVMDSRSPSS